MDERAALSLIGETVPVAGDDAAVVGDRVVTTDMLHDRTDFPDGVTRHTAGWRAVGASLSDVAAMGATAEAAVAVYAAPRFDEDDLRAFLRGASEVCRLVDAEYVGGDMDEHDEFTVASTALGVTDRPVTRSGARPGDRVVVTGRLGRTVAAMDAFSRDDVEAGNERFCFRPRVKEGLALAPHATAMMDSSDGLARSLHQLAEASDCGFVIAGDRVPVHDDLGADALDRVVGYGEDFELVATVPPDAVETVRAETETELTDVGEVCSPDAGVRIDGDVLPDRGYTHGGRD
jgi:thiamine-monophosphate kinase